MLTPYIMRELFATMLKLFEISACSTIYSWGIVSPLKHKTKTRIEKMNAAFHDKQLDNESKQDDQTERFNNMCLDVVREYIESGCETFSGSRLTPSALVWEAIAEGFNDKHLGAAGQDILLLQAIRKELDGDQEAAQTFINEFGRVAVQGAINYLLQMSSDDVAEKLSLCSCSIEPDQYIIAE